MAKRVTTTFGFKKTASLLERQVRRTGETRGFAVSRILTHWDDVVGPEIAAIAHPVNVSYAKGGFGATLTVLTTGPHAPMLEMQKTALCDRVNAAYGYRAIARIRITQTAPAGFAEAQARFAPASHGNSRKAGVPDQVTDKARRAADGVSNADLRAALERLGQNVLTGNQTKRGV